MAATDPEKEHMVNIPSDFNIARSSYCCIYKVPPNLWRVNPEAYTPQLIAIGPLHRKNPKLVPMEAEKDRYYKFFWQRCQRHHSNAEELLRCYESWLEEAEEQIRHSYAVKLSKEYCKGEFLKTIKLDAFFTMELFLRFSSWKSRRGMNYDENHDYMITSPWLHRSILRDFLLLENQIPMFVLDKLYRTVVVAVADKNQTHSDFLELAAEFFEEIHNKTLDWIPSSKQLSCPNHGCAWKVSHKTINGTNDVWRDSRHFTDMIRYFHLPDDLEKKQVLKTAFHLSDDLEKQKSSSSVLKTATQLNEAGVTFEKVENKCLFDIRFQKEQLSCFLCLSCFPKCPFFKCFKARFSIPQLKVDNWTESLFRNLIAFEQCHYPKEPYICNYVSLIDSLIHTKDDVELLVEKGVISHDLGSHKELATVVNGLCKYVVVKETRYEQIIDKLNSHYDSRWNRSMAALRLVYFRDPWRASSTVVGVAVLVFTIFNFCRIVRVVF